MRPPLKSIDDIAKEVRRGDHLRIRFSKGKDYVGYVWSADEERVLLAWFEPGSRSGEVKFDELRDSRLGERQAIGYDLLRHAHPTYASIDVAAQEWHANAEAARSHADDRYASGEATRREDEERTQAVFSTIFF